MDLLSRNVRSLTGGPCVCQHFKRFKMILYTRIMQIYAIPVEHMLKLPGFGE